VKIQEYISTGILESYVLGLTTEEENRQVESLALQYPEIKDEIATIEESLGRMVGALEKDPPPALKNNILARIRKEESEIHSGNGRVVEMDSADTREGSHFSWWIAASVTLLLVSSGINVLLYYRWKSVENELAAISNEKEIMAQQFSIERANFEESAKEMAILRQPENKVVMLKGTKMAPAALAVVYWNTRSHDVYLNVDILPATPPGMQYQLWAIVDGKPVDAGMIDLADGTGKLHKMKSFDGAQAFAITLEKKGGSPGPDLDALYLMGNV
jgi:anti-sigma-K factor RskA